MTGLSKEQLEMMKPGSTARPEIPEGMFAPMKPKQDAIEFAYGLLWIVGCDRDTKRGNALYLARKALYERLDKAGQARGITAARAALGD